MKSQCIVTNIELGLCSLKDVGPHIRFSQLGKRKLNKVASVFVLIFSA